MESHQKYSVEDLLGMGFTCEQISRMFRVSRWTIYRRIKSYGLEHFKTWTCISDEDLDNIVKGFYMVAVELCQDKLSLLVMYSQRE